MENPIERFAMSRQMQRQKALYEQGVRIANPELPLDIDIDYTFDNDIADPNRKTTMSEQQLLDDIEWQNATATVKQAYTGEKVPDLTKMSEQDRRDLAQWGLEFMGWFNYNIPRMGEITYKASNFDSNASYAMTQMMEDYDNKNISWAGTKRFFKGMITDPSTYLGVGTLGLGIIGRTGVKETTKAGIKEVLKRNAGKLAAGEGALYSGLDNALRQKVKIDADVQDSFDFGESAIATTTGALLGGSLLKGGQFLVDQLPTNKAMNKLYDGANEAQKDLVTFLRDVSDKPLETGDKKVITDSPPTVTDPGIKDPVTAKGKLKRKGKTPDQLTDIIRAGVTVDQPDEADAVVKALSDNFKVNDEGWSAKPGGYFDRKVLVETPEGKTAEVQIWSREISGIKDQMHEIYQKAREIEKNPKQKTEYEKLLNSSDQIAAVALAAGADAWSGIYNQIGLTVPGL